MTLILPVRGGNQGLGLGYPLSKLVDAHDDLNRALEEAFAGLLTVLCEGWPDWPIEIWTRLVEPVVLDGPDDDDEEAPDWTLEFRLFFAGEGPAHNDVTAMLSVVTQGMSAVLQVEPKVSWAGIDPTWKPLWAIDDAAIYRLLAPERTVDPAVYMLGHYAGRPAWFAAALEAWPLQGAGLPISLAEADTGWAFA